MKKVLLIMVAVMGLAFAANAQNNLGARFGGGQGYNAEISWQHGLGGNRLEADLGWANYKDASSFSLTGIYQFVFDLPYNFAWFIGPGASFCMATVEGESKFALALAGQVGIEYDFAAIPLQLSLDVRPRLNVIPSTTFRWGDIALGIRYMF
jgi:hypothetical protein